MLTTIILSYIAWFLAGCVVMVILKVTPVEKTHGLKENHKYAFMVIKWIFALLSIVVVGVILTALMISNNVQVDEETNRIYIGPPR
jgi:hypothetical protein